MSLSFGLCVCLLIGGYTVWDAHAVAILLVPPLLLDYAAGEDRAVLLAQIALRRRAGAIGHWRERRTGVMAIAVPSPSAYTLVPHGLAFTPVVCVALLVEVSVFLMLLAASLGLGEGRLLPRLIWSAVIVVGLCCWLTVRVGYAIISHRDPALPTPLTTAGLRLETPRK